MFVRSTVNSETRCSNFRIILGIRAKDKRDLEGFFFSVRSKYGIDLFLMHTGKKLLKFCQFQGIHCLQIKFNFIGISRTVYNKLCISLQFLSLFL